MILEGVKKSPRICLYGGCRLGDPLGCGNPLVHVISHFITLITYTPISIKVAPVSRDQ